MRVNRVRGGGFWAATAFIQVEVELMKVWPAVVLMMGLMMPGIRSRLRTA